MESDLESSLFPSVFMRYVRGSGVGNNGVFIHIDPIYACFRILLSSWRVQHGWNYIACIITTFPSLFNERLCRHFSYEINNPNVVTDSDLLLTL